MERGQSAGELLRPVIVGGGIAGLVVAWELARAGRRPLLLESAGVVGGSIARHTVAGLALDAGAESFATATSAVADLIRDLGLQGAMVQPNPVGAWVRHAGGTARLPTAALLGIPAHPFAADVRQVLGPVAAARAGLDFVLPAGFGARSTASLGALVGRRMGRTVVDRLVEPVAGGVYSTDPDALDVDTVQPRLRAAIRETGSLSGAVQLLRGGARPGSAVAGLSGGLFLLVDGLRVAIEGMGGEIRTEVSVSAIRNLRTGWQVTTSDGTVLAGDVILAVPGPAALPLLGGGGVASPIGAAATSDVLLVTLVVDHSTLDSHPRGTGVLVSSHATGTTAKALTHATAKWAWLAQKAGPGRHVLRLSYGRGEALLPPLEELVPLALADSSTLTGVTLRPEHLVDSAVVSWTSALPRPEPGHRTAMNRLRIDVAALPGLHVTGSMVAGTGLASVVADARSVAAEVTSALKRQAQEPQGRLQHIPGSRTPPQAGGGWRT